MSYEDEILQAQATFVVEGRELVQSMESALLGLESGASADAINEVFRAAHTIKGSSGLFGLDHVVRFTHVLESVLDRLRNDEIAVSSHLIGSLLPCCDHLAGLMDGVAAGQDETEEQAEQGTRLLATLRPYLDQQPAADGNGTMDSKVKGAADTSAEVSGAAPGRPVEATDTTGAVGVGVGVGATAGAGATDAGGGADGADGEAIDDTVRTVHLSLRFGSECLRNGMDPLAFIRYLSTLGEITSVTTLTDLLPELDEVDPEVCYLVFQINVRTDLPLSSIEDVFEFVRDDSDIHVVSAASPAADLTALLASVSPMAGRVEQIMAAAGISLAAATAASAASSSAAGAAVGAGNGAPTSESAAAPSSTKGNAPGPVGSAGSAGSAVRGSGPKQAAEQARPAADNRSKENRSIRVDASRLDRLIDTVGELVIAGASAGLRASQNGDEALLTALSEVMRLVEEVRDGALQLRMVPIGTTFSRFQRVVRDVSAALGKDIALVITGGDTEVDKALVERIGDPLMHLVRNSVDHGIEPAEIRAARGKPVRGTLRLNAFHEAGSIVIEVSDDGGGIDTDRVLAKAVERGMVEPGANLTDKDIFGLVFEPGFSTASEVSDLSGRGVGMDVVKRNVTSLRGTIDIESRVGEGTTVRIRLPLTLAIIDGFMVGVGDATFVIPLDRVVECVELPHVTDGQDCMDLRGEVLPLIRLRSLFSLHGERPRRENVVVVEYAGLKTGLVVDTLMGEFQTVIKPLGRLFAHVQGVGGSTILGNGDVALILDVPMLVRRYTEDQTNSSRQLVGAVRDS